MKNPLARLIVFPLTIALLLADSSFAISSIFEQEALAPIALTGEQEPIIGRPHETTLGSLRRVYAPRLPLGASNRSDAPITGRAREQLLDLTHWIVYEVGALMGRTQQQVTDLLDLTDFRFFNDSANSSTGPDDIEIHWFGDVATPKDAFDLTVLIAREIGHRFKRLSTFDSVGILEPISPPVSEVYDSIAGAAIGISVHPAMGKNHLRELRRTAFLGGLLMQAIRDWLQPEGIIGKDSEQSKTILNNVASLLIKHWPDSLRPRIEAVLTEISKDFFVVLPGRESPVAYPAAHLIGDWIALQYMINPLTSRDPRMAARFLGRTLEPGFTGLKTVEMFIKSLSNLYDIKSRRQKDRLEFGRFHDQLVRRVSEISSDPIEIPSLAGHSKTQLAHLFMEIRIGEMVAEVMRNHFPKFTSRVRHEARSLDTKA